MKKFLLITMVLALLVLHMDLWNWDKTDPIFFGFLPIGLAYHLFYSFACSIMMWVLVTYAWPKDLEDLESLEGPKQEGH